MRYSSDRNVHDLIRSLVASGWSFRRGSKHGQLFPPACSRPIIVAGTPSDYRCFIKVRADVRRYLAGRRV
jgi:hypothetical protein